MGVGRQIEWRERGKAGINGPSASAVCLVCLVPSENKRIKEHRSRNIDHRNQTYPLTIKVEL